jgi:hypothetical protein
LHLVSSGQPTITIADDGGRKTELRAPDSSANPGFVGTTTNHDLLIQAGTTAGGLNVMRFNTAGAERVRITDTGAVGIGTTNPGGDLTVTDASTYTLDVKTNSGAGVILTTLGASATLALGTNNTERARIDSSGRLLVGTSSTSSTVTALLQGNSGGSTSYGALRLARGTTSPGDSESLGYVVFSDSGHADAAAIDCKRDGGTWNTSTSRPTRLTFSTTADGASSPTERFKILSSGVKAFTNGALNIADTAISSGAGTNALRYSTSSGNVTYDTSTRLLKENIVDCSYGIDAVKLLKPRKYTRLDSNSEEVGFVADEVLDVIPEVVPFGPKSAITKNQEDTEDIPIAVNYDRLTAVLTKALQEAIAKIETLEAKVAALEGA